MPYFRKKSVAVEAFRYRDDGPTPVPDWFGPSAYFFDILGRMRLRVGNRVCPGDWIVREPDGNILALSPEEFEATYEPEPAAGPEPEEQR